MTSNKTAIVTGAQQGIGAGTAVLLADAGSDGVERKAGDGTMRVSESRPGMNAATRLAHARGNGDVYDYDEHLLVAKAKSGDSEAFGELYKRHQLKAFHTALRILRNQQDAEDAVQRAFQRALVNLARFREDSTFSTWLTRIAINEALMLLRQRRSQEPIRDNNVDPELVHDAVDLADAGPTPEEILSESERRATLLRAIAQLREKLRVVVLHRELQGLTIPETAQLLGLTVATVKARTFHARRFLRKHLARKFVGVGLLAKAHKAEA